MILGIEKLFYNTSFVLDLLLLYMFKHHLSLNYMDITGHLKYQSIYLFYQQSGDAKKPYLAQYSVVVEDSPVSISWTTMKTNIAIKNRLKPLKANFNAFLIGLIPATADNIINWDCILFYIIIIKYAVSEMRMQNLLLNCRHLIIVIFSFSFILF